MAKLRFPDILKLKERWNASRKKNRRSPWLGRLHYDIWYLVLNEVSCTPTLSNHLGDPLPIGSGLANAVSQLCEVSPETVRSIRLLNRCFNDMAIQFVFRHLVINTGAGKAKMTDDCLLHLLSADGEYHRTHITALTVVESYYIRDRSEDDLIEQLIRKIPSLQEFR